MGKKCSDCGSGLGFLGLGNHGTDIEPLCYDCASKMETIKNDIIRCTQCNKALGKRENLRQSFNQGFQQQYGGLFGQNTSVSVGRFTTDCPHCGKKIPLDL
ncbi:MAG: hypothetical protein GX556_13675 [Fibrobacter sp.]|nr:hypothetical protein [Fibrobacter sp.]